MSEYPCNCGGKVCPPHWCRMWSCSCVPMCCFRLCFPVNFRIHLKHMIILSVQLSCFIYLGTRVSILQLWWGGLFSLLMQNVILLLALLLCVNVLLQIVFSCKYNSSSNRVLKNQASWFFQITSRLYFVWISFNHLVPLLNTRGQKCWIPLSKCQTKYCHIAMYAPMVQISKGRKSVQDCPRLFKIWLFWRFCKVYSQSKLLHVL